MKYNWKNFEGRYTVDTKKITLNRSNINIGKEAFEKMGKPDRVGIYYDDVANAIMLTHDPEGRKITKHNGYLQLSSTLSRLMPEGRYYMDNQHNAFIFVKRPVSQSENPPSGHKER